MEAQEFIHKSNDCLKSIEGLDYEDGIKVLIYTLSLLIRDGAEEGYHKEAVKEACELLETCVLRNLLNI